MIVGVLPQIPTPVLSPAGASAQPGAGAPPGGTVPNYWGAANETNPIKIYQEAQQAQKAVQQGKPKLGLAEAAQTFSALSQIRSAAFGSGPLFGGGGGANPGPSAPAAQEAPPAGRGGVPAWAWIVGGAAALLLLR